MKHEITSLRVKFMQNWCSREAKRMLRQVQRITKQFEEGDRLSCERRIGYRRPRTSRTNENIEVVRMLIEDGTVALFFFI